MSSKDLKPKTRLGKSHPQRVKIITWMIGLLACGSGLYAAYHYSVNTEVEIAVAPVRRADFVVSVRVRGAIRSAHSSILRAPTVPGLRIVHLAAQGSPVKKGDVVVEFDPAQQQQNVIQQTLQVQSIEGSIDQMRATQAIGSGADTLTKMTSEYDVEKSKLDASKAAVISAIDGEKYRINVGVQEGSLQQVKASVNAHLVGNNADIFRMLQRRDKAARDLETANGYLGMMQLRAPSDGVVNVLGNFRSQGSYGQTPPPFKEGDSVWNAAEIVEIPDLSELFIDMRLEEVERGKVQIGQRVRIRVDAIPDKEFTAKLDYISPIAVLVFRGGATAEKLFPAHATLNKLDPRLTPGMSASAEVIVHSEANQLLIPAHASFDHEGKPIVYVQQGKNFKMTSVEVGSRNEDDLVVLKGLKEGDLITLESPAEAAKKARKKL
jgi:HlyD family secretion protein